MLDFLICMKFLIEELLNIILLLSIFFNWFIGILMFLIVFKILVNCNFKYFIFFFFVNL